MIIRKRSQLTGIVHEIDLPITQEQLDRWHAGELIQRVFPQLTPEQREFMLSGATKEEWDAAFGKEGDDE